MNNPIFFIDPDGKRIKIGDSYYSYEKDRNYDDNENYTSRRENTSTQYKILSSIHGDLSFTNKEEEYTTTLANQANEKLKEDKRTNYLIEPYTTVGTTTKEKKK
ncbi:hypothetical protein [Tenacibaculum litopenaei]|uniref:hypothetical protein n=1 Tax=Tenacibaculum litopenaei TaxID=396016 RepID=UPI0038B4F587